MTHTTKVNSMRAASKTVRPPTWRDALDPICLSLTLLSLLLAGQAQAQGSKSTAATAKPALTLSTYLSQVTEKHSGYKAADEIAKAAKGYSTEGLLLFRPSLSASASTTTDGHNNPFETASDRTRSQVANVGLGQQTDFGLSGKLSYNNVAIDSSAYGSYKPDWVQLELSQSLLRNWGGNESRATADAMNAGALAKSFSQSYITKSLLLEAESLYWRLALARELVLVQKDAVDRAQKIQDWTLRRVRLQLADRAEGLQSAANLQARRLDLRTAEDEERAASQAFNSSRGINSNVVSEKLVDISAELIAKMNIPARTTKRDDVQAAEFQAKASAASAVLARERNLPTLEIFGSTPVVEPSGVNSSSPLASSLSSTTRPATTIGIRMTAPLDFGTSSRVREGYAVEAQAADLNYQRKVFEEERDWTDLTSKFKQAKERLDLYRSLETTQREKLDYERDRQQRGRSTLQQVLFFETDYEQAQLGRIRTLAEILTLNAQMKLYGVSYESR